MQGTFKPCLAGLALALAVGSTAQAATLVWDGGGGDNAFSTATNWNPDQVPTSADLADINTAVTVNRVVDSNVQKVQVSGGATLNIPSGTHSDSQSGNTTRTFVGNGSTGTINLSGGSFDVGHVLAIAHTTNSNGTVRVSGGSLTVSRGSNSLVGGYGGNFALGHSVSVGGNNTNTGVTGLLEVSGGAFATRFGVALANNGTLSVVGSNATSIRLGGNNTSAGWLAVSSNGTLKAAVDAGGITPIFVEAQTDTSTQNAFVEFQAGSILDLSFVGTPAYSGTWTLVELEGQDIIGTPTLSAATQADPNWTISIDNSGANGFLRATYTVIPEPTSLALVGLGAIATLSRKRHRSA